MDTSNQTFASIITIGDELLIGQVIDTNSAFIAQELNKIGIAIKHRIAVADSWEDIWQVLDSESQQSKIIIITGGLGPTADDITKPLLCKYFDGKMIVHQETLKQITHFFENVLKRPMIERNTKQAEVPDVCSVLQNEVGTAPGMMFEKNGVLFFALPGVPHEMKWLMYHHVIPILSKNNISEFIEHRTLLTAGIGESFLAEKLVDFEEDLPTNIKLAYLPNYGMVRLRLTAIGNELEGLKQNINKHFFELKNLVNEFLITDEDDTLEVVVGKLLKSNNQTLSTAESCTGGYIAHLLSSVPGSSAYYEGSVVSYSYSAKENLLNVNKNTLEKFGAVSEETVTAMVKGVLQRLNTDFAIAVSGIMGPTGGTDDKPVGTVWIAVASKDKIVCKQMKFRFDREKNIQLTASSALLMLRELIVDKP
ncbi:MAG: competence/damage-inducible protein A [Chitinophagaceae bacterium]